MGLFKRSCHTNFSNLHSNAKSIETNWSAPNPNPGNFKILRVERIADNILVVEINYVGCTNYEGNKICVFNGISEFELRSLKTLDPHFSNLKHSPIARFKPDVNGWTNACKFARSIA